MARTATMTGDEIAITAERAVRVWSRARPSGEELALKFQRQAGNAAVTDLLLHTTDERAIATVLGSSSLPNTASVALMGPPTVMRDARETRIRASQAWLASRRKPSGEPLYGCYMNLLLILDAARGVRPRTTAGQVEQWRRAHHRATGATVTDIVKTLKEKGIAREPRWFSYPKAGRSLRTYKELPLQGDPEAFALSRARGGRPAYFAVSFRDIHSGFILVTSTKQVLWLDQFGEKDETGNLKAFLSRYLDPFIKSDPEHQHAWYASTMITELRF